MQVNRKANQNDYDKVVKLWNYCFGEDKYCSWFINNIFDIKNVIICEIDGDVAAMLIRMEYYIFGVGKTSYIYGACTKEKYRNRGIMSGLLDYSEKLDKQEDFHASMLIPANYSLFDYYNKRGFETKIFCNYYEYSDNNKKQFLSSEFEMMELTMCDAEKIINLYNYINIGKKYVFRNIEYIQSQINYYHSTDGFIYGIIKKGILSCYAFCSINEKEIFIDEIYYLDDNYKEYLLLTLNNRYSQNIFVREFQNIGKKYGCIKIVNKNNKIENIIAGLLFD